MARDLIAELNEFDGEWPAAWRPQEGEVLTGRIVRYSTGQGIYGPVRTAILEADNGERVSLWLSSKVLLGLFEQERPKVGERVGIRYLGKHPVKGYRKWALVVDRPAAALDFSPLGGEQGEAAEGDGDPFNRVPEQPRGQRTTDRSALPYATTTMGGRR